MEPIKNNERVKSMFDKGQTALVDVSSGYKYSMTACCPKDGSFSSIAETEKSGECLSRVVFKCSQCSNLFEAKQEDIYLW